MADTRKDKRAPVSLKVRFKSATVDEFIEHYSKDVSRGGIYIKSSQPMPVGTLLKFQFQLKDESALIRGVGRVVWTRIEEDAQAEQPAGMGIKFIKMDNDSRAVVERIVDSQADQRGTYESGRYNATSAEPSSAPPPPAEGGSFFPDLPPAELPLPEDRTAVRQATEFLAAALTEGGTDEASAREAQTKADEARRRTEQIEAQRREEGEAKKRQEAEARASLSPQAPESLSPKAPEASTVPASEDEEPEHDPELDTAPTPRSLPSMIIDPSLEPRVGRASEQTPGSDVTPLPRPNSAVREALGRGYDAHEPDTDPPPPTAGEVRAPTTSIPQLGGTSGRSYLPFVVIAALLLVGAIVFLRGGPGESSSDSIAAQTSGQDEAMREKSVPAALPAAPSAATPEPGAAEEAPAVVEPSTPDATVAVTGTDERTPPLGGKLVAVEISTSPRGAEVWVGDEKRGTAPLSLKLPVDVAVVVRATAPGHSEARLELRPHKKSKLGLKLAPLPYVVRVESTPPGAAITVGAHKGVTPIDLALDPPPTGQLVVSAKLDGYESEHSRLKLDAFTQSDGAMHARLSLTLQRVVVKEAGKEAAAAASPKERPKKPATAPRKWEPAGMGPEGQVPAAPKEEPAPHEAKTAEPAAPKVVAPGEKPPEALPDNPFTE